MTFLSTRQVARLLGINVSRLSTAVWTGRITEPPKGPGNAFLWGKEQIEQASWVLRGKSADDVLGTIKDARECLAF
jgi:hypothetical protein